MATPKNAAYKVLQQTARALTFARQVFVSGYAPKMKKPKIPSGNKTAIAVRNGKLNKKSGRRLATAYKAQ
jgi:hypothetical protein